MSAWPAPASPDRPHLIEIQPEGASWTGQNAHYYLGDLLQAHYSFGFRGQSKWAWMARHPWSPVPWVLMSNPTCWNELIYSGLACVDCICEYIISIPVQLHVPRDLRDLCWLQWALKHWSQSLRQSLMLLGLTDSLQGDDLADIGAPFGSFNLELRPIMTEARFSLIVRI